MATVIERRRKSPSGNRRIPGRGLVERQAEPTGTPPYPIYQISLAQYRQMAEVGVLTDDDRVELLEGWIVPKVTHNPPHDASVDVTARQFNRQIPESWTVRVQSAINTQDSEPEPDVAVALGPPERYFDHHPTKREIKLVVEVSEKSLVRDRRKAGLYAAALIPVYWIINLIERQIEVHTRPMPRKRQYRDVTIYTPGQEVPIVIDGREVGRLEVSKLLPPHV